MKVVTILNEKGGVGKTTLSIHLAAGLAIRGKRVILIDADPQGNATIGLGLQKGTHFYDFIVRNAPFRDVLQVVPKEHYTVPDTVDGVTGMLMVIPSNIESRSIAQNTSDAGVVFKRINQLRQSGAFDYVVFDTSPTPSLFHSAILMATDGIIYPTKCEAWSFDGLGESMGHKDMFQPFRLKFGLPEVETYGIVPTMYRRGTIAHSENLKRLREYFGNLVWEAIPQRTLWTEAADARRTVFAIAPGSKTEADAWKLCDQLEERVHVT